MNPDLSRAQGPGRIAMSIFGAVAVLSLTTRLWIGSLPLGVARLYAPGRSFVIFVGIIFYLVWLHRVTAAFKGQSRFTPGMAVGSWFIPFYNFVAPCLSLADVWRRVMGGQHAWLPGVWWATYLAFIVLNGVYSNAAVLQFRPPAALGWAFFAVTVISMSSWAFMLQQISARPNAPATVTA
jgi:hypothetical protein